MTTTPVHDPNAPRRLPWFIVGVLLFLLGPILTFVQFGVLGQLTTPWYMYILMTMGSLCMLLSVVQRGGVGRTLGFLFGATVTGLAWFMLLVMMALPPYTGPAIPGSPLPAFTAKLADGSAFSNSDLTNGQSSVLLFYRGHW